MIFAGATPTWWQIVEQDGFIKLQQAGTPVATELGEAHEMMLRVVYPRSAKHSNPSSIKTSSKSTLAKYIPWRQVWFHVLFSLASPQKIG